VGSAVQHVAERRIEEPELWLGDVLTKAGIPIREDDGAAPRSVEYTMFAGRQAANVVFERDGVWEQAGGRPAASRAAHFQRT
jgi:hypothetical protein